MAFALPFVLRLYRDSTRALHFTSCFESKTRVVYVTPARTRARAAPSFIVHSDADNTEGMPATIPFIFENELESSESIEEKLDAPWLTCDVCENTGFVPCKTCGATGMIRRGDAVNVFYCGDCVGHKKLRCPVCGGRCYMCG
jgi:hypothetical protein